MKISANPSSYRARGVIRRDARIAPDGPEAPGAVRGKKDRKRWCGGHKGREHKTKCMVKREFKEKVRWYVLACTECGKELENYFPFISGERKNPPTWVTP